jgi:hypothetical protein
MLDGQAGKIRQMQRLVADADHAVDHRNIVRRAAEPRSCFRPYLLQQGLRGQQNGRAAHHRGARMIGADAVAQERCRSMRQPNAFDRQ